MYTNINVKKLLFFKLFLLCKTIPFVASDRTNCPNFPLNMLLLKKYKMTNMMQDEISCLVKISMLKKLQFYDCLLCFSDISENL